MLFDPMISALALPGAQRINELVYSIHGISQLQMSVEHCCSHAKQMHFMSQCEYKSLSVQ